MKKLWIFILAVLVVLAAGFIYVTGKPSIAQEMHQVTWTDSDVKSWEIKNDRFLAEITEARRLGIKKDVQLEITEAEATAIASKTLEDILNDNSPSGIKQQIIQYSNGLVTGASGVQINYIDNKALVSGYVTVGGVNIMVAAKQHTEIINGKPRKIVDKYQAGNIYIPDFAKDEAIKRFGGSNSSSFTQGTNNYVAGNLKISGDTASADYNMQGLTENIDLKSVTMSQGKLLIKGTTK